jgi:hypothetical protein
MRAFPETANAAGGRLYVVLAGAFGGCAGGAWLSEASVNGGERCRLPPPSSA